MELPQEIDAFYTIPAVRRELARRLVKLGLSQRETAKHLGVTDAAVSQYLSNKRGIDMAYDQHVKACFDDAAAAIRAGRDAREVIVELCGFMKEHKVICALHKKHAKVDEACCDCYK